MPLTSPVKVVLLSLLITVIAIVVLRIETFDPHVRERNTTVIIFGINISVLVTSIYTLIRFMNYRTYSRRKSKTFFQLIKLSMDISSEVLRKVMCSRILSDAKYGGCLHQFLDHEKHYLYHQWQVKTLCCECPSLGCTFRKSRKSKKLNAWLFKKLYNGNPHQGIHVKYNGHIISKYCLDIFVSNPGLKVDHFDVTILSFFIEHFVPLSPKEMSALNDVVDVRNFIFHASNTSSIHLKDLESMWTKVSEASLLLTDLPSINLLKDQISMLKNFEFDNSDIEKLTKKVNEGVKVIEEMNEFLYQNCATRECVKRIEDNIVTKTECIQDDVKALKENIGVLQKEVNEMKIELHLSAEKRGKSKDERGEPLRRPIEAVARIDAEHIDERLVVENITKSTQTDEQPNKFMVVSAKQSCIILNLVCSSNVLKDEKSLQFAFDSLVCDIIEAGKVNTDLKSRMVVELQFCSPLTKSELNAIEKIVSTGKQVHSEKLDVYKVLLTSPILTSTSDPCFFILTEDSYLPEESDIKVIIQDEMRLFSVEVSTKVIKNVIEFKIPWTSISLYSNELYISMVDTKRRIQTSKYKLRLDISSELMSESSLITEKEPISIKELVEKRRKLKRDSIEHDEIRKEIHQPDIPFYVIMIFVLLVFTTSLNLIFTFISLEK